MKDTSITPKTPPRIDGIEETTDTLTSRAGLALFARYLDSIGLSWFVERWFGPIRKNAKGISGVECLRQVVLFMVDGTSRRPQTTLSSRPLGPRQTESLRSGSRQSDLRTFERFCAPGAMVSRYR